MNDTLIYQKIRETLAEEFELDAERIVPEAHIRDDLGLDSLDIVDMVIVLEKAFGFKLPDRAALADVHTVGDICALIVSLRDAGVMKQ